MTTKMTIRARYLKGLLHTAASKDVRYYLNGVHVDTDRGHLVSTTGHVMTVVKTEDVKVAGVEGGGVILTEDLVRRALKLCRKGSEFELEIGPRPPADPEEGPKPRMLTLRNAMGEVSDKEIDGRFPDYMMVIPGRPTGVRGHYNPQYVAQVHTAMGIIVRGDDRDLDPKSLPIYFAHNGDGAALMACSSPWVIGIVMPVRGFQEDIVRDALRYFGAKSKLKDHFTYQFLRTSGIADSFAGYWKAVAGRRAEVVKIDLPQQGSGKAKKTKKAV